MAETTGAAPRRTRTTTTKPAAAKAPAKPAAKPAAAPKPAEAVPAGEPLKVELTHVGDTKTYAKFAYGERGGPVIANIYAPPGTARVMVAVIPGEPAAE